MKKDNLKKGQLGEDLATKYLEEHDYIIIERNFENKYGEIDIIASKNNKLIFIEVKMKIDDLHGTPEDMITKGKISQVKRTAIMYLQLHPDFYRLYPQQQIDGICIKMNYQKQIERFKHYENIS